MPSGSSLSMEEILQQVYDSTNKKLKITLQGLTVTNDGTKTTLATTAGDYFRIGDAVVTSHSLDSEDDLLVTGETELEGNSWCDGQFTPAILQMVDDTQVKLGNANTWFLAHRTDDANAHALDLNLYTTGSNHVPVFSIWQSTTYNLDMGLFDGVTQPTICAIEKNAKYAAVSNATSTAANATLTTATAGTFTAAVVGDVVRVTAGTNATAGWYWITTVTSAVEVILDRTWCTAAVTGGTIVVYHDFTMLSADGICTRITDGAPSDASVEIDRDGWLILDVGQANGRLYWRANNAWHYVDATL